MCPDFLKSANFQVHLYQWATESFSLEFIKLSSQAVISFWSMISYIYVHTTCLRSYFIPHLSVKWKNQDRHNIKPAKFLILVLSSAVSVLSWLTMFNSTRVDLEVYIHKAWCLSVNLKPFYYFYFIIFSSICLVTFIFISMIKEHVS